MHKQASISGNVIEIRVKYAGLKFLNVLYLLIGSPFFLSRSNSLHFLMGMTSLTKRD